MNFVILNTLFNPICKDTVFFEIRGDFFIKKNAIKKCKKRRLKAKNFHLHNFFLLIFKYLHF